MAWSCVLVAFGLASTSATHADSGRDADEAAIRQLVSEIENAWRDGDGAAFGAAFTEDADFMVWFGLYLNGRERIAEAHQNIFDGVYAGTEIEFRIDSIRFLGSDVALVRGNPHFLASGDDAAESSVVAVPLGVAHREDGSWKFAAIQNTPFLLDVFSELPEISGDIREFRQWLRESAD